MKRIFAVMFVLSLAVLGFSEGPVTKVTLVGTIIDNVCAAGQKATKPKEKKKIEQDGTGNGGDYSTEGSCIEKDVRPLAKKEGSALRKAGYKVGKRDLGGKKDVTVSFIREIKTSDGTRRYHYQVMRYVVSEGKVYKLETGKELTGKDGTEDRIFDAVTREAPGVYSKEINI